MTAAVIDKAPQPAPSDADATAIEAAQQVVDAAVIAGRVGAHLVRDAQGGGWHYFESLPPVAAPSVAFKGLRRAFNGRER